MCATLALAACANTRPAPYSKPALDLPAQWKAQAPWREGNPSDSAPRGPWWTRFGDARLSELAERAMRESPTLAVAAARLAQARATVNAAGAGVFPQVNLSARDQRFRIAANRPLTNYNAPNFATVQSDHFALIGVAYEADLWGRVQSTIDVAKASEQQSRADLENLRLLLGSDLAANYFNLRGLDIELDVLGRSIALQRRALDFVRARHELGAGTGLEVAQQQALLDNTLTQVELLRRQRAQFENAIGTLTGTPASGFTLPAETGERVPPAIPAGIPSDLLERRPDIAAAERAVAAANAQVGVARAAFYPSINLGTTLGLQSRELSMLFDLPSLLWSIGATLTQPLFDGGRLDANLSFASAGQEAAIANYRRVVLTAIQEVEDGIAGARALDQALAQAAVAVASAQKVLRIATDRYEGGVSTYLEVITAQQSLLTVQRQQAQVLSQRMLVSVLLIKALGGDWAAAKS